MRVLVVGGTGFTGPHVVTRLVELGHEAAVFHRGHTEYDFPPGVEHFHHACAEMPVEAYPAEVVRWEPEVVVHMIAVGEADAAAFVRAFHGVARRSVVISSGDVYRAYGLFRRMEQGPLEAGPLTEESALRESLYVERAMAKSPSHWVYHYDKVLVERVVRSEPGLPATVLRLPKLYGPRDRSKRLLPYFLRFRDRRPAILLQDDHADWRFTSGYAENVADAIVLAITEERAAGQTYNVGEPETLTTGEWMASMGKAAGWEGEVVGAPAELMPTSLRQPYRFEQHIILDSAKIRRELAYSERVPVSEAIQRTADWERAMIPEQMNAGQMNYRMEDQVLDLLSGNVKL